MPVLCLLLVPAGEVNLVRARQLEADGRPFEALVALGRILEHPADTGERSGALLDALALYARLEQGEDFLDLLGSCDLPVTPDSGSWLRLVTALQGETARTLVEALEVAPWHARLRREQQEALALAGLVQRDGFPLPRDEVFPADCHRRFVVLVNCEAALRRVFFDLAATLRAGDHAVAVVHLGNQEPERDGDRLPADGTWIPAGLAPRELDELRRRIAAAAPSRGEDFAMVLEVEPPRRARGVAWLAGLHGNPAGDQP
jgi:hypothetical protein